MLASRLALLAQAALLIDASPESLRRAPPRRRLQATEYQFTPENSWLFGSAAAYIDGVLISVPSNVRFRNATQVYSGAQLSQITDNIDTLLPPGVNIEDNDNAVALLQGDTHIAFSTQATVEMTFLSEGAGFVSSLGYIAWDTTSASIPDPFSDRDGFLNWAVSNDAFIIPWPRIDDTVLSSGDTIRLEYNADPGNPASLPTTDFPAGSAIVFFVLPDAYGTDGDCSFLFLNQCPHATHTESGHFSSAGLNATFKLENIIFSIDNLNDPVLDSQTFTEDGILFTERRHVATFLDQTVLPNAYVYGIEDIKRTLNKDDDMNDVTFFINVVDGEIDNSDDIVSTSSLGLPIATESPTESPTDAPTASPTNFPTDSPTDAPSGSPTVFPTPMPTFAPTNMPLTPAPTDSPTDFPTNFPTDSPTAFPTPFPTPAPSDPPSPRPSPAPSAQPSLASSADPTLWSSAAPTVSSSVAPSASPSKAPTVSPTIMPSLWPTPFPSASPSDSPSAAPTAAPSLRPSGVPSKAPSEMPSTAPSEASCNDGVQSGDETGVDCGGGLCAGCGEGEGCLAAGDCLSGTCAANVCATAPPSLSPSKAPTAVPTSAPTFAPSSEPSLSPTLAPSAAPSLRPSAAPSRSPTKMPSPFLSESPTAHPSKMPSADPSAAPTAAPTAASTPSPSAVASLSPTAPPTAVATAAPSPVASDSPTAAPSAAASEAPTAHPSAEPSESPTAAPSGAPSAEPSAVSSAAPSDAPSGAVVVELSITNFGGGYEMDAAEDSGIVVGMGANPSFVLPKEDGVVYRFSLGGLPLYAMTFRSAEGDPPIGDLLRIYSSELDGLVSDPSPEGRRRLQTSVQEVSLNVGQFLDVTPVNDGTITYESAVDPAMAGSVVLSVQVPATPSAAPSAAPSARAPSSAPSEFPTFALRIAEEAETPRGFANDVTLASAVVPAALALLCLSYTCYRECREKKALVASVGAIRSLGDYALARQSTRASRHLLRSKEQAAEAEAAAAAQFGHGVDSLEDVDLPPPPPGSWEGAAAGGAQRPRAGSHGFADVDDHDVRPPPAYYDLRTITPSKRHRGPVRLG